MKSQMTSIEYKGYFTCHYRHFDCNAQELKAFEKEVENLFFHDGKTEFDTAVIVPQQPFGSFWAWSNRTEQEMNAMIKHLFEGNEKLAIARATLTKF